MSSANRQLGTHSTTKEWADKYSYMGFSIFPVPLPGWVNSKGKKYDGKTPFIKWAKYQSRIANPKQIQTWFSNQDCNNNIAVVTGSISRIFVLDIDGEKAKIVFQSHVLLRLSTNIQNALEKTMHVRTGGDGGHIYFRYKYEDFPDGIDSKKYFVSDRDHQEIAINGNGRYVISPPSIHPSGNRYELLSDNLITLSKEEIIELLCALDHLNSHSDNNNSHHENNDDISETVSSPSSIKLDEDKVTAIAQSLKRCYFKGNRDDIVFALSGYLYRHYIDERSVLDILGLLGEQDEQKQDRMEVVRRTYNRSRNSSKVSGYRRFLDLLSSICGKNEAKDMLSEINKVIKEAGVEQGFEVPASGKDQDNKWNSFSIEDQLLPDVRAELSRHVYKFTCLSPPRLTIAHSNDKKIFHAYIKNRKNEEENSPPMQYMKLTDVIIDAIPKNVIIYDNSPVGSDKNRKLEIQFESRSTKRSFTAGPGTINSIIDELQNRNMVIKRSAALDALTAIVGAFERDDKAIINDNVTTSGYYLVGDKLCAYDVTQNIASWPEQSQVVLCTNILDDLAEKKYKNKDIFPTIIKWAIVAPFSYALKGVDNNNWMPWLQPYGVTKSGKSTLGVIVLAVWRKHTNGDKKDHQLGFNNIDSVARLGNAISKSTYPVLVNEIGGLSNERYYVIIEMIKHAVENQNARGKFVDGSYNNVPALSPFILTSNVVPPADPAYRRRVLLIHFTREETHDSKEAEEFRKWLSERIDALGVLGDFAAKYLIENSDLLRAKQWEDIAKTVLMELYKAAGAEHSPYWLNYLVEQNPVEESNEETHFELRAFFMDVITNTYSRHIKTLTSSQDAILDLTFASRLDFCLNNELVPFLHQHVNRKSQQEIAITADVFSELKKRKIENITHLRDLGNELGFEYCQRRIGGKQTKVVCGERRKFIEILEGKIIEDDANEKPDHTYN
jgi:Bifunctional DNA primase/polymerase, N-terminal